MCMQVMVRSWSMQPKHAKTIFHIVGTVPGILVYICIYIYILIYEYVRVCIYIYIYICVCTLGPDRNDRRSPEAPAH